MRDYGKVSPQFWTGKTGKVLRGNAEAQVVALYLMTSPHANMIGVYHLPMLYLAHETGLSPEAAQAGMDACVEHGFCFYDSDAEMVFVVEMAAHQVGEVLKDGDRRGVGIDRQYRAISSPILASAFFNRYGEPFNLDSPLQAPSKGDQKGLQKPPSPAPAPVASKKKSKESEVTLPEWIERLAGGDAIAADDPLFRWAQSVGVPREWIALAWWGFEARYTDNPKRYSDWRAVFRRAVKEDWLKLWRVDRDGGYVLTTAGEALRREMGA